MSFVVGDGHTEVEVNTLGEAMKIAQLVRLPGPGILDLSRNNKKSTKTLTTALVPVSPAPIALTSGGLSMGAKVGLGLAAIFVLFLVFRARKLKKQRAHDTSS